VRNLSLLGDFAKGFVIMTAVFWIFAVIEFVYIKQITLATLFLISLIIPLSMIGYEYLKNRKKDRTQSCKRCGTVIAKQKTNFSGTNK
jgi:hypothetical protein